MKKFQRLVSISSTGILVVGCAALLIFCISGSGWKALIIPTGSMRPTIPPGSLVLMHRVPTSSLKVGDVITYTSPIDPKITISHRIIKKYFVDGVVPGFVTKGDANKYPDSPIVAGSINGKVIWHVSHIGYWMLIAKKPIVILPIVYITSVLIMIEEVIRLRDYYKGKIQYRLKGYLQPSSQKKSLSKLYSTINLTICALLVIAYFGPIVIAAIKSNTVDLANNRLTVAAVKKQCMGITANNTSITIGTNNSQSSTSGNTNSPNGGTAISGGSSNNSSSTININVNNQC